MGKFKKAWEKVGWALDIRDLAQLILYAFVSVGVSSVTIGGLLHYLESIPRQALILYLVGVFFLSLTILPRLVRLFSKLKIRLFSKRLQRKESTDESVLEDITKPKDVSEAVRLVVAEETIKPTKQKLHDFYKEYAFPPYKKADEHIRNLAMRLLNEGDVGQHNFGYLIRTVIIPQTQNAHKELWDAIKPDAKSIAGIEKLQNFFANWFEGYKLNLDCIIRSARMLKLPFLDEDVEEYKRWSIADSNFRRELYRLIEYSELHLLRHRIHSKLDYHFPDNVPFFFKPKEANNE